MKEIKCPECGKVFTIDENSYAAIQKQVRDREFNEELKKQTSSAVQLAEAEKDRVITELRGQLHSLHAEKDLAVREAESRFQREAAAKEQEIIALRGKLQTEGALFEAQKNSAVQEAVRLGILDAGQLDGVDFQLVQRPNDLQLFPEGQRAVLRGGHLAHCRVVNAYRLHGATPFFYSLDGGAPLKKTSRKRSLLGRFSSNRGTTRIAAFAAS